MEPKPVGQRDRIIRAATRIMAQKGYGGTSIQEIADAVKIHKTTIFHYFKSKQEILQAGLSFPIPAMTEKLRTILDDPVMEPIEKLRQAIKNHVNYMADSLSSAQLYNTELRALSAKYKKAYMASRKTYHSCVVELVQKVQQSNSGHFQGLDPRIVANGVLGMTNWMGKWFKPKGRLSSDAIGETFFRMLVQRDSSNGTWRVN